MTRTLTTLVFIAIFAACDRSPAPPSGDDPSTTTVTFSGDAGSYCLSPDEGCPCEHGEEPVDCWVDEGIRAGNHVCGVGTRYCVEGQWGACDHVERYALPAFSVVDRSASAALIAGPGSCNVCDPGCSISTDRPDDGDLTDDNSDNVEYDPGAGGIRLPPSSTGVPSSADRDRDGIPDLADDCPLAPGLPELFGCPAGSGTPGIYHELPFDGPAVTDPCVIDVQVRTVDVYFLMDTTGSMGGEINNLRSGLTSGTIAGCAGGVIGAIRCAIPDAWFGVGYHDDYPVSPYGAGGDAIYRNLLDITDNLGAAQTAVNGLALHNGNDWPEGQGQALWSIATGGGLGAFSAAKAGCPGARWGYPCFREDAIPVVVLITDAPFHNGTTPAYDYAATTPTAWQRTTSGQRSNPGAARAGSIGHDQVSAMSATFTLTTTTTISFWYRVSSEANFDFFHVVLDGVELDRYSGNVGWTQWSRSVPAGTHTLTLVYSKDGSVSSGSDTAWVDDVSLGATTTSFNTNLLPFGAATGFGLSGAPSWTDVTNALVARGVKVLSIESSGRNAETLRDLNALAYATDSVDATGNPFVFSIPSDGSGLSDAIVDAVRYLADYSRVDVSAVAIDNPTTAGVDERDFVENIVAASWGPRGSCQSRSGNRFEGCLPGTDTNFQVSFRNDVVMPSATTQVFTFWIRVLFNDSTIAFEKEVRIVVPPAVPACATVEVGAARVIPNIMFLVDRSGSMDSNFGMGRTRWQSSKDAIIGRNGTGTDRGVVGQLESTVRFGLQTYAGSCTNPLRSTAGARTIQLNNWSNIDAYFRPEDASGSTPTFEALQQVYNQILASPPPDGPPIVVLVTDGEPNGCASNPRAAVVNEVRRAFTAGIRTFVISVGTGVAASHLQDIANAGVGSAAGAPYWVATDPGGLVTAVNTIVVGARSCEMDVTGAIDPDVACLGEVRLGGTLLTCNDPTTTTSCSGRQGWRRVDGDTIELCGNACTTLLSDPDATLSGQFPCAPITGRYWRTYDATERCEIPPNRAQWGELTWVADFPAGTAIVFEVRTADTEAELDSATAARVSVTSAGPPGPVDVGELLRISGLPTDRPFARVTAVLQGSVDRARSPVLTEMALRYDCVPAE